MRDVLTIILTVQNGEIEGVSKEKIYNKSACIPINNLKLFIH